MVAYLADSGLPPTDLWFSKTLGIPLTCVIACLLGVAIAILQIRAFRRRDPSVIRPDPDKPAQDAKQNITAWTIVSIALMAFTVFFVFNCLALYGTATLFWRIEADDVASIDVYKLDGGLNEHGPDARKLSPFAVIDDPVAISACYDRWPECEVLSYSHEGFRDGYLLAIHLKPEAAHAPVFETMYIALLQRSTKDGRRVHAIEPLTGLDEYFTIGLYSNEALHQWAASLEPTEKQPVLPLPKPEK